MATLTAARKPVLRRELEALVGADGVLSEPDELLVYESDGLTLFRALADFIVFPTSVEQVSAVVRLANREAIPFVARGAGTGLAVVLPDGEIVWLGGRTRDALGYDLAGVFVGSEGTFGIATKIVVRILRKPQAVKTVLAVFDRIEQASAAVSAIIARGLVPAAVEMIDQLTIQAVEDAFGCGYPRDAAAALLIELDGLAVAMETQAERIVAACRDAGAREGRTAASQARRLDLGRARHRAREGRLHAVHLHGRRPRVDAAPQGRVQSPWSLQSRQGVPHAKVVRRDGARGVPSPRHRDSGPGAALLAPGASCRCSTSSAPSSAPPTSSPASSCRRT